MVWLGEEHQIPYSTLQGVPRLGSATSNQKCTPQCMAELARGSATRTSSHRHPTEDHYRPTSTVVVLRARPCWENTVYMGACVKLMPPIVMLGSGFTFKSHCEARSGLGHKQSAEGTWVMSPKASCRLHMNRLGQSTGLPEDCATPLGPSGGNLFIYSGLAPTWDEFPCAF